MRPYKKIEYGIDSDTGYIWSRQGSYCMVPVIDFANMKPEDSFAIKVIYEKHEVHHCLPYAHVKWTRKIPIEAKNKHRELWGMKPLMGE